LGYINAPQEQEKRFVPNPYRQDPTDLLYRTGDRGRYRLDGQLEILGREDDQVKIHGVRVEPSEITATLAQHPDVEACYVAASTDPEGQKYLVAYFVGTAPGQEDVIALRNYLAEKLPAALVPRAYVPMPALPLTPSGKVDRRSLPEPATAGLVSRQPYVAPRTPTEDFLAEIWSELLNVDQVGMHDNFFALGGHSLLAVRVVSRVRSLFNVELPLRELFEAPTIDELAERIQAARERGTVVRPPIVPIPRDGELPLSLTQESLWFLDQLEIERATYTRYRGLRLIGPLDVPALERTLHEILRRHEALRTRFPEIDGRPVQVIEPPDPRPLRFVDLSLLPEAERESGLRNQVSQEVQQTIDLQNGPLIRLTLFRLAEEEHAVLLTTHHIIYDGWSVAVLARELSVLYQAYSSGQPSPLPELPIQYADFAAWQRQMLQGETFERLHGYWSKQLANVPPLELPTDYPRPAIRTTRGARAACDFSPELSAALSEFCRQESVTPYMALLAGLQILLARYSGQGDFAIGSPSANRTQRETEGLIGYFINVLVMRSDLSGGPNFRELVRRVRQTVLDAFDHQDMTLDHVVDAVKPQRDLSRHPLFQVMFVLQNTERAVLQGGSDERLRLASLGIRDPDALERSSYFDLMLGLYETEQGFQGGINYNTDLFRSDTIDRMVQHFRVLLAEAIADPDRPVSSLSLLTDEERRQLVVQWNDTETDFPLDVCIHTLFDEQVERSPNAVALIDGSTQWTYRELNERANQLAHWLQHHGVVPDQVVGVRLPRSADFVVAILGVLKAGGAYLPLDTLLPAERLHFVLEDAEVDLVVTRQQLRGDLPDGLEHVVCVDADREQIGSCLVDNPVGQAACENLAYVIYTSGSTGRPKGVMIEHRALVNYTQAAATEYSITSADRVLQFASVSYDAHVEEIYPCLTRGGTLVLRSEDMLDSYERFLSLCHQWELTVLTLPTGFWRELTAALDTEGLTLPGAVRVMIIGGEQALASDVTKWFDCVGDGVRLLNTYGPTETTVVASSAELGSADGQADRVPIGRPLANMRTYVLDGALQPVPIGVHGELYIGGESVARGYLKRPELTEQCFLPDPFVESRGARMYKTGDLVRWRADGRLEFVGRVDHQVKIRGFRIEPGEVEQVLSEHPLLAEAVVVARERALGDLQLVAYLVGKDDAAPTIPEMRRFLADRIPDFMIPAAFVPLDSLPTTTSGKVNRRALPEPDWSRSTLHGDFVAPRTPTEKSLAEIWSDVLNIDQVGVHDNFFDLGGNSLSAIRLTSRVRDRLSAELPLIAIFTAPTVAELAERIEAARQAGHAAHLPPVQPTSRDGHLPLSYGQEALWLTSKIQQGPSPYVMHPALRINGPLDVPALERTVNELLRRHEALRTTFSEVDGQPVQVIAPCTHYELPLIDLSHLPAEERENQVRRYARQQSQRPIDLARGPLARIELVKLHENEHAVLIGLHHIIYDGWSLAVLRRELLALYQAFAAGSPSPLGELSIQYADFAVWQRKRLEGEVYQNLRSYWLQQLEGLPPLELPADFPRPRMRTTRGGGWQGTLSRELSRGLNELAQDEQATLFVALMAAFQAILGRYSGQEDFAVGTPVAGRLRPETENVIGFFVNTLVLRADCSDDPTFREMVGRVRETALEAFDHQEMPFEWLVQELSPRRDPSRHPVFQAMLVLQNAPSQLPGMKSRDLEELAQFRLRGLDTGSTEGAADFDLLVSAVETDQGIRLSVGYRKDLFEDATIERMMEHFQVLLQAVVDDPDEPISQLSLMTERERQQVLLDWGRSEAPQSPCVHSLFQEQVERTPDAEAAVFGSQAVTYQDLNARANQLAHYLHELGVGPDALVGICLERSLDLPVAVLAVLKAGGAYVPLDPAYPQKRLQTIVEDSQASVILTQRALVGRLPECPARLICVDEDESITQRSPDNPTWPVTDANLTYVLYTSGSTGKPKGVAMEHRPLVNLINWQVQASSLSVGARTLAFTSINFDVSFQEMFATWCSGGSLVLVDEATRLDPFQLLKFLEEQQIQRLFAPFVALRQLAEADGSSDPCKAPLEEIITAGEQLQITPQIVKFFERHGGCKLHNQYGPTEGHVVTSFTLSGPPSQWPPLPPIGRPIANARIYILDARRQPVPMGLRGELYIGGAPVARGYLGRPDLTEERFVADPFSENPSNRMYKTGDMARWLPDGNIEFIGRSDAQVKIRGFRVELGEIEAVLSQHPAVQQAVVTDWEAGPGDTRLVAYVVVSDEPIDAADSTDRIHELREFLKATLPDYMIPQAFTLMNTLPLTPSGKVNRRALPEPDISRASSGTEYVAPTTETGKKIAAIWQEVLKFEPIGVHDDFFNLGGHSLLASQVLSRINQTLDTRLTLRDLFEKPTIAGLEEQILSAAQEGPGISLPPIRPVPRNAGLPLSYNQEGLWLISKFQRGRSPYVMHPALHINGPLNVPALEQTVNELLRRHESLRTTFAEVDGEPVQVIAPYSHRELPLIDLSELPLAEREEEVQRYARQESQRPVDLAQGPLARMEVVRLQEDEHVVLVGMHHIIYDGWSLAVLRRELLSLYQAFAAGLPSPLSELPIQYADFAVWQRERLEGAVYEALRRYWLQQLEDLPPLELPTDFPRPKMRTTRSGRHLCALSSELSRGLTELAQDQQATLFMALMAAFQTILSRYSGQEDFAVGAPVAGRLRPETENLIGLFVNTLVLRADLTDDPTFRELVGRVRETSLAAFDRQEMPFERLVQELRPRRDPSRHPVFQAMLVLQNIPQQSSALKSSEVEDLSQFRLSGLDTGATEGATDFDLLVCAYESDQGVQLSMDYRKDLFEHATIERMLEHFQVLLAEAVADPDRPVSALPLISEEERRQMVVQWNDTATDFPRDVCIHELFADRAADQPDATAVVFGDDRLSYRQLNEQSNQLAHHLRSLGVGPDVLVGIYAERSMEMVVGLLGVLKAGGAYVPLDPSFPQQRIQLMLEDTQAPALLVQEHLLERLSAYPGKVVRLDADKETIARQPTHRLETSAGSEQLAYVMYTSGSTGRPKGVMISHRALVNLLTSMQREPGLEPSDVLLSVSTFSFDIFGLELYLPLLVGATVVMTDERTASDAILLQQELERSQATVMQATPATWRMLLQTHWPGRPGLKMLVGGEVLDAQLARELLKRGDRLWNLYGPTETTVYSTSCQISRGFEKITVGRPINNTQIYILDERMAPSPVGVCGEIYIGGDGLARGYLNQPELTDEKFVVNPLPSTPGTRLYKTGDQARWLANGEIDFLGRVDHQVKVRGFRVELGEIESVLLEHEAVHQAVVVARADSTGEQRLVAYVVYADGQRASVESLRESLSGRLPHYMIPSVFETLQAFPLTPNGKVDRKGLPEPSSLRPDLERQYVPPRTATEETLAGIWSEMLGIEQVGVHDEFFDLGGHSLLANQVLLRINQTLDTRLTLRDLFEKPTIAGLEEQILSAAQEGPGISLPPIRPALPDGQMGPVGGVRCCDARGFTGSSHAVQDGAALLTSADEREGQSLVLLGSNGTGAPLFCIHGMGGHVATFVPLARQLTPKRPVYGLQAQGLAPGQQAHDRIEDMASYYVDQIRGVRPQGPYLLAGWSMGGLIAIEVAHRLNELGQRVELIAMLDTYLRTLDHDDQAPNEAKVTRYVAQFLKIPLKALDKIPVEQRLEFMSERASSTLGTDAAEIGRLADVCRAHLAALSRHMPTPYNDAAVLFLSSQRKKVDDRWSTFCPHLIVEQVSGDHYTMLRKPAVDVLAERLGRYLQNGATCDSKEGSP
jgi:amino acid adenylation domain-containing protein